MSEESLKTRIYKFSEAQTVQVEFEGKQFPFSIKPMSARLLASISNMDKDNDLAGMEKDKENASKMSAYGKVIYPMCERMLPVCCVDPKIYLDEEAAEKDKTGLWIEKVPLPLLTGLFEHIFDISGLSDKKEDETKK